MKKQIQTKKIDIQVYSTIKKLSLAMTIIGWTALVITFISAIAVYALSAEKYDDIQKRLAFVLFGGIAIMVLYFFLSIGQIVLGTKVKNITPVTTGKQAIIVFAVALGIGFLTLVGIASLLMGESTGGDGKKGIIVVVLGLFTLLAYNVEAIASTIILAQIKVNKPIKKGK